MRYLPFIFSAASLAVSVAASHDASAAGFVKCVDADGKTIYTDGFCPQPAALTQKPDSATSIKTGEGEVISAGLGNVLGKQVAALQWNNWSGYLDTLAARRRAEAQLDEVTYLRMAKSMAPADVRIVEETIAPDGKSGILKIKGKLPMSGSDEVQYGMVELVKESGDWKIDSQAWSGTEWVSAKETGEGMTAVQKEGCAELKGRPESLPAQDMMKVSFKETQLARFALPPGATKEVHYPAAKAQKVSYRVAFNRALKCKYKGDYPTGMSADGGRTWVYSYHAGQTVKPAGGQIKVLFKNRGQEPMNFVVVAGQ